MLIIAQLYNIGYNRMDIYTTKLYDKWFTRLKDLKAKAIINTRLRRIELNGNMGDYKTISENVTELHFDYGSGYRIYLSVRGTIILILLLGGRKDTQERDIKKAEQIAKDINMEDLPI
jgi:putative addiction module killer protein